MRQWHELVRSSGTYPHILLDTYDDPRLRFDKQWLSLIIRDILLHPSLYVLVDTYVMTVLT